MATERIRTLKNGSATTEWIVYFYKQDGKRSSKTFRVRSKALAFERQARIDRAETKPKLIKSQNLFIDAVDRYRQDSVIGRDGGEPWSEASLTNFDRRVRALKRFVEFKTPLSRMDTQRLREIRTAIQKSGAARSTQVTYWSLLKSILTHSTLEGLMSSNPAYGLRIRPSSQVDAGEEKFEVFSKQEAGRIVALARESASSENPSRRASFERLALLPSMLFDLGLRIGELQALEWAHINLEVGNLLVCQDLSRKGKVQRVKAAASHRRLVLSDRLTTALVQHKIKFNEKYVFSTSEGRPLEYRNLLRWWHLLCDRAGVPKGGFHKARHYYASRLIEAGASPKVLTTNMGHADVAFTLQVYGHLFDDHETREQKREMANELTTLD